MSSECTPISGKLRELGTWSSQQVRRTGGERCFNGLLEQHHYLDYSQPVGEQPKFIPLKRAYEFGRALRRACEARPERIAVIGTGGISHWPATPDSGRINEVWDREFLENLLHNRREALLAYRDEDVWREGGQEGFEIRTFIAVAGATEGCAGELWCYVPIPIFAVGCTVAVMRLS